jgi:UDP-N-acetylglucosamine acyltransferase
LRAVSSPGPDNDTSLTQIHPTALVSADARLEPGVSIGPYAILEPEVTVGARCEVRAHATLKRYTQLGSDNVVHEGAVLGGEPQDLSYKGGASALIIGARNRLREGVTLHRANTPGGRTQVGSDCFLMAYVHVAHDCVLDDRVILANNVALAGHVHVGERAFLSGGVVVHQFCRVGRLAMVGGNTKVVQDCLPFVITDGHPGRARGLNIVGLRRAGFSASQVRLLRRAYRLLLHTPLPLETRLTRLQELGDALVDEWVTFVRTAKRGFARARRHEADASE